MKYHLGCGLNYLKGYINVDKDEKVNPDVVGDVTIIPWIWAKPNNAEEIRMNNLAEHLTPFIEVVQECHRTLKNGGIFWIKVPFLRTREGLEKFLESVEDCFADPTHHLGPKFTVRTFEYFDCNRTRWKNFGKSYGIPKFKLVKQEIKDRFLIVELEAVK